MHNLVALAYFFSGLGVFMAGVGVLVWASNQKKSDDKSKKDS